MKLIFERSRLDPLIYLLAGACFGLFIADLLINLTN
jgi:hypothetical protein